MKIAVIVPAYNEEASIRSVVQDIKMASEAFPGTVDVIVVNDGSSDSTANKVADLQCVLLNLPINLGIGGAVQLGVMYAYEQGYDIGVQVDGDGQHPANEIATLITALQEQQADVVIGSRFLRGEGFRSTPLRRLGIQYFNMVQKFFTGNDLSDCTSGFRAMNRKALAVATAYYPDEYPEPESLIVYSFSGLKVGEVAVSMRERQGGQSSIRMVSSVYYMAKVTLALAFTYLRFRWSKPSWKA